MMGVMEWILERAYFCLFPCSIGSMRTLRRPVTHLHAGLRCRRCHLPHVIALFPSRRHKNCCSLGLRIWNHVFQLPDLIATAC